MNPYCSLGVRGLMVKMDHWIPVDTNVTGRLCGYLSLFHQLIGNQKVPSSSPLPQHVCLCFNQGMQRVFKRTPKLSICQILTTLLISFQGVLSSNPFAAVGWALSRNERVFIIFERAQIPKLHGVCQIWSTLQF